MADKFETNNKFRRFAWAALIILGIGTPLIFFATYSKRQNIDKEPLIR